jgi:hypothetical protein
MPRADSNDTTVAPAADPVAEIGREIMSVLNAMRS